MRDNCCCKGKIDKKKPVLLCVSFGTSYNEARKSAIETVEKALQEAFPTYEVRRAFTSQMIINKLKNRDNVKINNVTEALDILISEDVKNVIVQPTHIMSGFEYNEILETVRAYKEKFNSIKLSTPLLENDTDIENMVEVLTLETKDQNNDTTAFVWMGHGSNHSANSIYEKVRDAFVSAGHWNYFVGTVEAEPTIETVLDQLKKISTTNIVLLPLMLVAGDHATNDMAGDDEDSWKSVFEKAGYKVQAVLKGLGEFKGIRQMIINHTNETIEGTGVSL